jgi:hypothetical protein
MKKLMFLSALGLLAWGCQSRAPKPALDSNTAPVVSATKPPEAKAVYEMTPAEIGQFVAQTRREVPDLRQRVVTIARRNLGQKYSLHLLGEYPFEIHDGQPLYCLENGDCVVFAEHVYAMALSYDWQSFFAMLQRIRYQNGEISAVTRNHYTLADWNENNAWLIRDITPQIAAGKTDTVTENINRKAFSKKSFDVDVDVPNQSYTTTYVPARYVKDVAAQLRAGDCVNVIRVTKSGGKFCGHVGMIGIGADGTVNLIHSTPPKSIEQPLVEYVEQQLERNKERERKGEITFQGLKFLRLVDDPVANLIKLDGPDAPIVTGPRGLLKKFLKQD